MQMPCTVGSWTVQTCGATTPIFAKVGMPRLMVNGRACIVVGTLWGFHARPKSAPHPEFSVVPSARLTVGNHPAALTMRPESNGATEVALPCRIFVSA